MKTIEQAKYEHFVGMVQKAARRSIQNSATEDDEAILFVAYLVNKAMALATPPAEDKPPVRQIPV